MSLDAAVLNAFVKKFPVPVFCFIISAALATFLYFRLSSMDDQRVELVRALEQAAIYEKNITNSAQLDEQLATLIKVNQSVKLRCLKPDRIAENLQFFYRIENETGVKYGDLRPASNSTVAKGKVSTYQAMGYIINAQGSFSQVVLLLKRFENGYYFSRVNNLSLSANGAIITINLSLDVLGAP